MWMAALVAACAAVVALASRDPRGSDLGPGGFHALREYLRAMGAQVGHAAVPPDAGEATFVLLADLRDAEAAEKVLDWVAAGGRLVLTDPLSEIAGALGLASETVADPVLAQTRVLVPGCAAFAGAGIAEVSVSVREPALSVPEDAQGCFPVQEGLFVALIAHGEGHVAVLGGPSALTNRYLRAQDNAVLAYRLLGGLESVVFGPPIDPAGIAPAGPWETLPSGARSALAVLVVVLVVLALVRGRRFGRPVVEEPASPIPSSQLVRAMAGLYQSAGAAGYAGELLKDGARRRVARRLGLPPAASDDALATALRRATIGTAEGWEAVRRPVGGDDDLIRLADELAVLEEAVDRT